MATTVIRVAVANSRRQSSAEQYSQIARHHQHCCRHSRGISRSVVPAEVQQNSRNLSSATCVCCGSCRATRNTHPLVGDPKSSCSLDSQATRLKSNFKKCLHKHFPNKDSSGVSDKEERAEVELAIEAVSSPISAIKMTDIKKNGFSRNGPIITSSAEKREHLYKILVIGELGTGKTSFIKRYVHQFFSQNYRATIGVDFALKVLHWDSNTVVRLQLWDIAGQERFGNMTRVYYKEAVGAFIVFDVTRSGTFDCVSKWKEDLDSKVQLPDGSPIPCILLANKCDQDKQGIITTPEKMDEYVKENGFAGWYETSAKENINIDEAARALVNKILLNDKLISAADIADSEKFNLANSNGGQTTTQAIKSKCSC